jgi:hypothetical protein
VIWKKNFGGTFDEFYSVTKVSDGIIVAGTSTSFGTGDWEGVTGNGGHDAIIVKYDNNGNVVWKKNFGGSSNDYYQSVTVALEGLVAVGRSAFNSFGTGDWEGVTGKGDEDAIIVCHYNDAIFVPVTDITDVPTEAMVGIPLTLTGTVVPEDATHQVIIWSVKNAGGTGATIAGNIFTVTATGTATVTATIANGLAEGTDYTQDFNIIVHEGFVPVVNITDLPTAATTGLPLTLAGTVLPANATHQTIVWSVKNAGNTGATITGNIFNATAKGTVIITATIVNGLAEDTDYTQDFTITVSDVGIERTDNYPSLQVYPNPTTGELRVESGELRVESVEIFDVMGKKQKAESRKQNENLTVLRSYDLTVLPFGIYFIRIQTENSVIVRKVVKQ